MMLEDMRKLAMKRQRLADGALEWRQEVGLPPIE